MIESKLIFKEVLLLQRVNRNRIIFNLINLFCLKSMMSKKESSKEMPSKLDYLSFRKKLKNNKILLKESKKTLLNLRIDIKMKLINNSKRSTNNILRLIQELIQPR